MALAVPVAVAVAVALAAAVAGAGAAGAPAGQYPEPCRPKPAPGRHHRGVLSQFCRLRRFRILPVYFNAKSNRTRPYIKLFMRHTPCMGRARARAPKRRRAGPGPGPCRRFRAWGRARPMQGVCLINQCIYVYIFIYYPIPAYVTLHYSEHRASPGLMRQR